jgi:hypothetical protein
MQGPRTADTSLPRGEPAGDLTLEEAAIFAEFSVISTRRYGDLHRGSAAA